MKQRCMHPNVCVCMSLSAEQRWFCGLITGKRLFQRNSVKSGVLKLCYCPLGKPLRQCPGPDQRLESPQVSLPCPSSLSNILPHKWAQSGNLQECFLIGSFLFQHSTLQEVMLCYLIMVKNKSDPSFLCFLCPNHIY